PSTFFDVAKEYMILPFLEDTMEAGGDYDGRTCEDTIIDSDDLSLYLSIYQLRSCNEEPDCFDPHMFIRNLPDLPDVVPNFHPTTLLNETQKMQSTTLVLDLDAYRESCIFSDGSYTKDLTILGVDLAKIAIIDKSLWADFLPIDFH
ncbi:hypothetical protein LOK49_LG06G01845, partial [Camellia lanceoleosa]